MGQEQDYARYLAVRDRKLALPVPRVAEHVEGRTVLVTGATGCVGGALLRQVAPLRPAKLVGIGLDPPGDAHSGTEYHRVDVRDPTAVRHLFDRTRPDIVFHLAAQRDPGLAEREVRATVATNVLGTANVVEHSHAFGVRDLVYASTGKAMRPYTRDVYAASKKLAEWLVAAGPDGRPAVTIARFTHVVDNSIVLHKFHSWCRSRMPLRLHDSDALFYAQSAVESAQLLLGSLLIERSARPALCAIRDLEWPFRLSDIAQGVLDESDEPTSMLMVGEEPGYEQGIYPGLYDPRFSGGISPLINLMEGHSLVETDLPGTDVVRVAVPDRSEVDALVAGLQEACTTATITEDDIRIRLDHAVRRLLDMAVAAAPDDLVRRIEELGRAGGSEPRRATHRVIEESIRARLRAQHPAPASAATDGRRAPTALTEGS